MEFDLTQPVDFLFEDEPSTNSNAAEPVLPEVAYLEILDTLSSLDEVTTFPLFPGVNTIGRKDCSVVLNKKGISKKHAVIDIENDLYMIYDLGSSNKTRKGKAILKPNVRYSILDKETLYFGNVKSIFKVKETESDTESIASSSTTSEVIPGTLKLKENETDASSSKGSADKENLRIKLGSALKVKTSADKTSKSLDLLPAGTSRSDPQLEKVPPSLDIEINTLSTDVNSDSPATEETKTLSYENSESLFQEKHSKTGNISLRNDSVLEIVNRINTTHASLVTERRKLRGTVINVDLVSNDSSEIHVFPNNDLPTAGKTVAVSDSADTLITTSTEVQSSDKVGEQSCISSTNNDETDSDDDLLVIRRDTVSSKSFKSSLAISTEVQNLDIATVSTLSLNSNTNDETDSDDDLLASRKETAVSACPDSSLTDSNKEQISKKTAFCSSILDNEDTISDDDLLSVRREPNCSNPSNSSLTAQAPNLNENTLVAKSFVNVAHDEDETDSDEDLLAVNRSPVKLNLSHSSEAVNTVQNGIESCSTVPSNGKINQKETGAKETISKTLSKDVQSKDSNEELIAGMKGKQGKDLTSENLERSEAELAETQAYVEEDSNSEIDLNLSIGKHATSENEAVDFLNQPTQPFFDVDFKDDIPLRRKLKLQPSNDFLNAATQAYDINSDAETNSNEKENSDDVLANASTQATELANRDKTFNSLSRKKPYIDDVNKHSRLNSTIQRMTKLTRKGTLTIKSSCSESPENVNEVDDEFLNQETQVISDNSVKTSKLSRNRKNVSPVAVIDSDTADAKEKETRTLNRKLPICEVNRESDNVIDLNAFTQPYITYSDFEDSEEFDLEPLSKKNPNRICSKNILEMETQPLEMETQPLEMETQPLEIEILKKNDPKTPQNSMLRNVFLNPFESAAKEINSCDILCPASQPVNDSFYNTPAPNSTSLTSIAETPQSDICSDSDIDKSKGGGEGFEKSASIQEKMSDNDTSKLILDESEDDTVLEKSASNNLIIEKEVEEVVKPRKDVIDEKKNDAATISENVNENCSTKNKLSLETKKLNEAIESSESRRKSTRAVKKKIIFSPVLTEAKKKGRRNKSPKVIKNDLPNQKGPSTSGPVFDLNLTFSDTDESSDSSSFMSITSPEQRKHSGLGRKLDEINSTVETETTLAEKEKGVSKNALDSVTELFTADAIENKPGPKSRKLNKLGRMFKEKMANESISSNLFSDSTSSSSSPGVKLQDSSIEETTDAVKPGKQSNCERLFDEILGSAGKTASLLSKSDCVSENKEAKETFVNKSAVVANNLSPNEDIDSDLPTLTRLKKRERNLSTSTISSMASEANDTVSKKLNNEKESSDIESNKDIQSSNAESKDIPTTLTEKVSQDEKLVNQENSLKNERIEKLDAKRRKTDKSSSIKTDSIVLPKARSKRTLRTKIADTAISIVPVCSSDLKQSESVQESTSQNEESIDSLGSINDANSLTKLNEIKQSTLSADAGTLSKSSTELASTVGKPNTTKNTRRGRQKKIVEIDNDNILEASSSNNTNLTPTKVRGRKRKGVKLSAVKKMESNLGDSSDNDDNDSATVRRVSKKKGIKAVVESSSEDNLECDESTDFKVKDVSSRGLRHCGLKTTVMESKVKQGSSKSENIRSEDKNKGLEVSNVDNQKDEIQNGPEKKAAIERRKGRRVKNLETSSEESLVISENPVRRTMRSMRQDESTKEKNVTEEVVPKQKTPRRKLHNSSMDMLQINQGLRPTQEDLESTSQMMPKLKKQKTASRGKLNKSEIESSKLNSSMDSLQSSESLSTIQQELEPPSSVQKKSRRQNNSKNVKKDVREDTFSIVKTSKSLMSVTLKVSPPKRSKHDHLIMITGIPDYEVEEFRTSFTITEDVKKCTVLVMDKFKRTAKALCCVARGLPIVSKSWLISSMKNNNILVDLEEHRLQDRTAEKQFSFVLKHTLGKSLKNPLLTGWKIHATENVLPPPQQMEEIIESAGGKYLKTLPSRLSERTVVMGTQKDSSKLRRLSKTGIPVVTSEFILTGILQYAVDTVKHKLDL